MKKQITLSIFGWLLASLSSYKTMAQETPPPPPPPPAMQKETQEITIRKKGDKDVKMTVEITGDKVLLNGKPLVEFNEEGVTVNNRKMIVRDGNRVMIDLDGKMFDLNDRLKDLNNKNFEFKFDNDMESNSGKPYTLLGVTTNKVDEGLQITDVTKDSPADKAGLQENDIIYKIDDKNVSTSSELSQTIRAMKDGEKAKIFFLRNGKKKDTKATLVSHKESVVRSFSYSMPNGSRKSFSVPPMPAMPPMPPGAFEDGMFNENITRTITRRPKLGLKIQDTEDGNGIKILEVENASAAASAGLIKDDMITEIGGTKVKNTDEAREQLQNNKEKSAYDIKARRNGNEMTFSIKIPKKLKTADL